MKCPRCEQDSPTEQKFCGECGAPLGADGGTESAARWDAEVTRALSEALEQQAATAEILRTIASSPSALDPVLMTVAERAARLCDANDALIFRKEPEGLRLAARWGTVPTVITREMILPVERNAVTGRAVLDARVIHIPDIQAAFDEFPAAKRYMGVTGVRTVLAAPLLRESAAIGVILIRRLDVQPFGERQIALLETFANQAVIAIENVRLLKELKARNRDLTEALEQQTATSAILRVIAASPTDVRPILDTIVENAGRVCDAEDATLFLADGAQVVLSAYHGGRGLGTLPMGLRLPLTRETANGRAILDAIPIHVHDLQTDQGFPLVHGLSVRLGVRSALAVPLIHDGAAFGSILIRRTEVRPFSDRHIELLKTFADQAVIAIENVRLFKELAARNTELTDTLARESATGEVLRAISRAQTDAQPVFDIIAESAQRLCDAGYGQVALYDGALLHMTAFHNVNPEGMEALRRRFPAPADRGSAMGRALQTRAVVQIPDVREDLAYAFKSELQTMGFQSLLVVPMLRKDEPIGAIAVGRRERGAFPDKQIELLKTFADQAVIAIENVRLFKELEARTEDLTRSVGELRALSEVGQAISSSLDLRTVLSTIVARATQLSGTDAGVIYEYDEEREVFVPRATAHVEAEIVETMLAAPVRKGEGATGRLAEVQEPNQVPDISVSPADSRVRGALVRAGYRALLAVPLVRDDHLLGGLNQGNSQVRRSNYYRRSRLNRPWQSRTRGCSARSQRRVGSSKPPVSTNPNSSPICPTNCGRH
jgi:two-component system NtrC family sensor kinase